MCSFNGSLDGRFWEQGRYDWNRALGYVILQIHTGLQRDVIASCSDPYGRFSAPALIHGSCP